MAQGELGSPGDEIEVSSADKRHLKSWFPGLGEGNFRFTSPQDPNYNCVAWAVGDTRHFTWPMDLGGYSWPAHVASTEAVESFVEFFEDLGFQVMDELDAELEDGYEKVALYAYEGRVTHVARQVEGTGWWTSKLSSMWDIEHARPVNLQGNVYGEVVMIMRRSRQD